LILFLPFDVCFREFRFELLYATYQTIISPFGHVRFKDFFLGDIFTSMPKPLVDAAYLTCFMTRMPKNAESGFALPQWDTENLKTAC
jgi:hypothetical protein